MDNENEQRLDKIIAEYSDRLIKYCYSIVGNYHDAEDATQETFVKLYYKMDHIHNEEAVVSYMYRIAYTIGIDILRSRKRANDIKNRYESYIRDMPETYEINTECGCISDNLYQAIMTLKPIDRALVHAVAVEQLRYSEVAEIIGKKEATLRKRYERALKKIKLYLEEREEDIL